MHTEVQFFVMWPEIFFLGTPMSRAEYIKIHSKYLPPDIIALYQIDGLIYEYGYVCSKIIKGMHGLK